MDPKKPGFLVCLMRRRSENCVYPGTPSGRGLREAPRLYREHRPAGCPPGPERLLRLNISRPPEIRHPGTVKFRTASGLVSPAPAALRKERRKRGTAASRDMNPRSVPNMMSARSAPICGSRQSDSPPSKLGGIFFGIRMMISLDVQHSGRAIPEGWLGQLRKLSLRQVIRIH